MTECTSGTKPNLLRLGVAIASVVAAMVVLAAPYASASESRTIKGFGSNTQFSNGVTCSNQFGGRVTADDGNGGLEATIDSVSFAPCNASSSVTPRTLPWKLALQVDSNYTIQGFDVDLTTPQGTCRYAGLVRGDIQFPGGVYTLTGSLTRLTAGCGGPGQLSVGDLAEVISISG